MTNDVFFQVKINEEIFFDLNFTDFQILAYDIDKRFLLDDLKRRIDWVINHKIDQCYERFKAEWIPKLMNDPNVQTIPATKEDLIDFVTARPDYKDREEREE